MKRLVSRGAMSGVLKALRIPLRIQPQGRSDDLAAVYAAFEHSPDGALIADAETLGIVAANAALKESVGSMAGKLTGLTLSALFSADGDPETLVRRLRDPHPRFPIRLRQRGKDGSLVDVEASGYRLEIAGRALLAYSVRDITVRSKAEGRLIEKQQRLDHLAHHDQLTGLPNRHFLTAHLPGAIDEAKARGAALAVLFLDLDRFKDINDSRGHETGDRLLQAVAERIRGAVRRDDLVVRMGGDEFVVILKDVRDSAEIAETATRITQALSAPVVIDNRPLMATASIGVSLYPRDGATMGELLSRSDAAMYQAKDAGRNNFKIFSPIMDRELRERVATEASLRTALECRQLDIHYQPIVEVSSQRVAGLEALLRWKHPIRGLILPERFVAAAEETGLIVPMGEFVLERAMQDARRWREAGCTLVPLAVNISAVQLERSDLSATIERLAEAHDFDPGLLQLEFTESTVFERRRGSTGASNEEAVASLRELGVRTAIDDFGTGYSSLSYLKRWKFDYLKIDRSFIRDLVTDPSDLAIVAAIIAMAQHLHIPVIAEGVEGWQQLEKLRELGCSMAQGYLFGKPAPPEACRRFLRGAPLDLTQSAEMPDLLEATVS